MKNKKAILMPETLKIIIAVMCLLLLAYLSINLYGVFSHNTEIEQAKATLNNIVSQIKGLEKGELTEVLIENPRGWRIIAFEKELCICKSIDTKEKSEQQRGCLEEGVCYKSDIFFDIDNVCSSFSGCIDLGEAKKDGVTKTPFTLHIARLYDRYYFGLKPYASSEVQIPSGYYGEKVLKLISTPEFNNLVKMYVENPLEENKQNLILNINSHEIIKDALSRGLSWKLGITVASVDSPEDIVIFNNNILPSWKYSCKTEQEIYFTAIDINKGVANPYLYLLECKLKET